MKNILKTVILAFALAAFTSCSNPLDREYNPDTLQEDLQVIVARDKIRSHEDIVLLSDYIQLSEVLNISLEGKTYRQLLEEARELNR